MKQMESQPATEDVLEPISQAQGATIFTFLDAADRVYDRVSQALKKVGLSYPKYDVLQQLLKANGSLSLRVLAENQGCAASNITQIMDRLEAEGMVRRVDDPDDRRSVRAELTPEGARLADEGNTQIDLVRAHFAAAYTAAERQEFGRLLSKID